MKVKVSPPNLRTLTLLYIAFIAGSYSILHAMAMPAEINWLAISTVGAGYVLWYTSRHLHLNHPPNNTDPLPNLGWANSLTLFRGALIAMTLGFSSPNIPRQFLWFPAIFYTIAATADFFDGYIARATGEVTRLGAALDLHLDGIGVLVASIITVTSGQLPWWYLSVGLARYLFLLGIWLIERGGGKIYPLPPSNLRRTLSGVQMGFLAGALYPIFAPPLTTILGILIFVPFMVGFTRDFLAVAGWIRTR